MIAVPEQGTFSLSNNGAPPRRHRSGDHPMTAIRSLLAAAALLSAAASSTAFAAPLPVVNQGESFSVSYEPSFTGNIVGGGTVRLAGQGESQQISYNDSRLAQHAAGIPVFTGGSEGDVAYLPLATSSTQMAAR
jgi:hypothetical protein